MQAILETAKKLIDRGFRIIAADGKRPLGGKRWQLKDYTVHDIERLLRRATNPAIGMLSGRTIDIEADGLTQEEVVAELFAGTEMPVTPSYKSSRGLHRLFAESRELTQTGRGVISYRGKNGATLGIRVGAGGKGVQSIVPPSPGRTWLPGQSIDDCDFAPLPQIVVERILAAVDCPYAKQPPLPDLPSDPSNLNDKCENEPDKAGQSRRIHCMCPLTLEEAIAATLPSGPGHRNLRLFAFARCLKGMPEYRDRNADDLYEVVRQWHAQALPYIQTKAFAETWQDFLVAWNRVRTPARGGPLATIVQEALSEPFPAAADRYDDPNLKRLVAVTAKLQQIRGVEPFFLTCRDTANLLGGSATQRTRWSKYLHHLCDDGVLRRVTVGTRRKASEFYYMGGQA
jgi:hypothetical protein